MDIYCIAIGGTGMAPLACLLKQLGHRVRGVDNPLYPPMSQLLDDAGIEPLVGYDAGHLEAGERPDLVVVGNAVPRSNPEAQSAERLGLERLSMPQTLARFLLDGRRPLVVAGTHGKTTTSSIAAWVYSRCGHTPGFLIGGIPKNLERSFQIGSGERFIIEGDEYNAAYFDRGPKFLHYRPHTLILTSAEYDHADLYPTPESLLDAYRQLVELVPEDGRVIAYGDSAEVRRVVKNARCETVFYGLNTDNDIRPIGLRHVDGDSLFSLSTRSRSDSGSSSVSDGDEVEVRLQVAGEHNLLNALAVWAAAMADGLPALDVASALAEFTGAKRRLDEVGTHSGITVVDDFAHHPTAVEKSIGGVRQRYPGRRLVVLFEPRSLTAGRSMFHQRYLEAFGGADIVMLAPIFHHARLADDERLDLDALVTDLRAQGVDARRFATVDALADAALELATEGDVLVTMSSGAFDGMPQNLAARLS